MVSRSVALTDTTSQSRWEGFRCVSIPTYDDRPTHTTRRDAATITHDAHYASRGPRWKGAVVALVAAITVACASVPGRPSVQQVQTQSGRFVDHSVTIDGRVTTSWGVPLVGFNVYRVDDGTGEITVVSTERRVPGRGAEVEVKGKVEDVAVAGWPRRSGCTSANSAFATANRSTTSARLIKRLAAGSGRPPSQASPALFSCTRPACSSAGRPDPGSDPGLVKSSTMYGSWSSSNTPRPSWTW